MSWDPNNQKHGGGEAEPNHQMKPRSYYVDKFAGDENGVVRIMPGEMMNMVVELMCDLRDIAFTTLQCTQQVLVHTIEMRKENANKTSAVLFDPSKLRG